MLEVKDFTKIYKLSKKQMKEMRTDEHNKVAASHIDFIAPKGEIFGLLGPNGAGKTTTLRSIATLLTPTAGEIFVNGVNVVKEADKVRGMVGFLTNDIKMDENFTADYIFEFFGKLRGMDKEQIDKRKQELFSYFNINEYKDKKIEELSTGMKQKLAIAVCVIHDPEIVIFDEPTNGLDIITAKAVTDYLLDLRARGKTIIISTHIMSVAEKLCDRMAIIIQGKKVEDGKLDEILKRWEASDLEDAFFKMYVTYGKEEK
ncbi:ABC transporter ATP-binding protein [Clostridiales bacterium COT073_COT-073]|nr:ABC transporter ATP-binding protein [Clostridiales bacterium COT073_COT-073]